MKIFKTKKILQKFHFLFKKKQILNLKSGFTLVEILVVTSIIIMLSSMLLANYELGNYRLSLDRALHKLVQDIRRAEEMAMSSNTRFQGCSPGLPQGYGVYFDLDNSTSTYILFADCTGSGKHDLQSVTVETMSIEEGIFLNAFLWPPGYRQLSIVFKPPDPTVCIVDCISGGDRASINLASKSGLQGTVSLNKRGLIEILQ